MTREEIIDQLSKINTKNDMELYRALEIAGACVRLAKEQDLGFLEKAIPEQY